MRKLEYLSSLCEERTTFTFRIMRLSAQKVGYSDFIESVVLLIEYLQLLSQAFLVRFEFYSNSSLHSINLANLMNPIAKGLDLSYITEYNDSTSVLVLAILIFAILALWRLTLFCYVCYIAMKKSPGNNVLVQMWKWIFCIQGRILCFLLTSLLIGFFQSLDNKLETSSLTARCIVKTSFWIFVVAEYIMSIIYKKYFSQVLPNKTFLSSKTDSLVILTLAQKFIVQMLCISLSPSDIRDPWMYCVIGLVFDLLRIYHFLTVLPFYKSKALFLQGSLLAMMFSFNIASAFYSILDAAEYSIDMNFLIGLWIILTIIAIKGMRNYLFEIIIKTMMNHKQQSPAISSHKVFLLKEFRSKGENVNRYTSKYDWKTLAIKSINSHAEEITGMKGNLGLKNLTYPNSKNTVAEFCLKSLNDLSLKFPKDLMLKLYVAYYYAKKVKKYTIALRMLSELQKSSSFTIRFNASLLLEEVQSVLRAINENSQSRLDIFTYTRSRYKVVKLKQNMHKQAQLEITIYKEMQQSFPNLASIFNTAQIVHNQKLKIGNQIKTLNQTLPEYYLEPITLCAYYHLVLNHLIPEYLECMKKFSERKQKYQKIFNANQLRQENLYQSDAAVVYVSGMRENRGKITYASKKAIELYGQDPVGQDTGAFITPFLMSFWKKFSSSNYETGEFLSPNAMSPMFLYNPSTGYVTATTRFFNVHPFIWAGLHFVSVIRPISDSKEYILISENGEIQGFTEKIAKRLKLASSLKSHSSIGIKIGNICPVLEEIDKAITLFGRLSSEQRKQQAEDPKIQNAKRIYDVYSTTGEEIKMRPLNSPREFYSFHCRVSSQNFGNMFVKHLTLEEVRQENSVIIEAKKLQRSPFAKEELTLQRERSTQANSPLIQPFEPEEIPTTNRSLLLLRETTEKDIFNRVPTFAAHDMSFQRNSSESVDLDKGKKLVDVDIDAYSMNSQRSNSSSSLRKLRAYNKSLASNYHSRKYTIFLILLFTMLCGILINQNVLKIKLDNYVYSLKTRKDVLTIASARSLKLLDIHRNLRSLWWFGIGKLNVSITRGPGGGPPGIVSRLSGYIRDLSAANKELRIAADRLDPSIRELVFRQDVRMYETNYGETPEEFINVTNFEATDSIVADCLQVSQQALKNLTKAAPQIGIMLRNIPNDILLQTDEVADLFIDSLHGDMDNNLGIILRNSASILSVLLALLLGFNYTLYSQYIKEKRNMIAIRAFDLKNIHTVQDKLLNFCKLIEEESSFEDLPTTDVQKFYYRRSLATKSNALTRKETDFWNSVSGISKKYWFYSARLSVFIFCIIGFIVLNMVIFIGLTSGLNTKTRHLQLIGSLTENITLLGSIAMDMASENDTTLILNARPSTLYVQTLRDISKGKNRILDDFDTNSDGEYDFLVPLLYENQCSTLTSDLQGFCMNITSSQKTAGFIQLMTYMESVFVDFKNKFDSSNKSTRALQSFWAEAQTSITRNIVVVQTIAISIETAVDQNLEESISSGLNKNKIILSITCYSLVIICVLIYWTVLVKVRESDNQFKRVLQVFPANVVLSNFILRSYVIKTACGALDFIKSEL